MINRKIQIQHFEDQIKFGRSFNLRGANNELIEAKNIFCFGCAGNAKEAQKQVAAFMNQVANGNTPDFIIILGDNFYDDGVTSPLDKIFASHFYDIYSPDLLANIKDIPCFVVLGNHDYNYHNLAKYKFGSVIGWDVAKNQIIHSYCDIETGKFKLDQEHIYNQDNLKISELPKWVMPRRYYKIVTEDTDFFFLDSNTFAEDYVQYMNGSNLPQKNQVAWLIDEVNNSGNKKKVIAQHHCLYTPGQRKFGNDLALYIRNEQHRVLLKEKFNNVTCYNTLIRHIFEEINVLDSMHALLAAHDHNMSFYIINNNVAGVMQIGSGGAGGGLQDCHVMTVDASAERKLFQKDNGFVQLIIDNDISYRYYIKGMYELGDDINNYCQLVNGNFQYANDIYNDEENLRKLLFTACQETYLDGMIKDKQEESHGAYLKKPALFKKLVGDNHGFTGTNRAHRLLAIANAYKAWGFDNLVEFICKNMEKGSTLDTVINSAIESKYGFDLTELNRRMVLKRRYEKASGQPLETIHIHSETFYGDMAGVIETLHKDQLEVLCTSLRTCSSTTVDHYEHMLGGLLSNQRLHSSSGHNQSFQ